MDIDTSNAIRRIAAAHRSLADELEQLLATTTSEQPGATVPSTGPGCVWDPETDEPLMQPRVVGSRDEQDWCCLTYIGGIYAINKRYGRGANAKEISYYAKKAGYQDGRAVTAWSKGRGATQNDPDKQRWVTAAGLDTWVKQLAPKLGVALPPDLAESWEAPEFRTGEDPKNN